MVNDDTDEEANAVLIYECSEKYVGIYYHEESDGETVFQSLGDTPEEARDDMIETLNHLPQSLQEIQEAEADLVDVRPLQRREVDDD